MNVGVKELLNWDSGSDLVVDAGWLCAQGFQCLNLHLGPEC